MKTTLVFSLSYEFLSKEPYPQPTRSILEKSYLSELTKPENENAKIMFYICLKLNKNKVTKDPGIKNMELSRKNKAN